MIGWKTTHGLDKVWDRIKQENLLLDFQQLRLISLIDRLNKTPFAIGEEDKRFVEILQRKLQRTNSSSFTIVVVEQLLKALEANKNKLIGQKLLKTRKKLNPITQILTEYYEDSDGYPDTFLEELGKLMELHQNMGILLRAGVLVQNTKDFLRYILKNF